MKKAELKLGTYQVIKIEDKLKYLNEDEQLILTILLQKIGTGRHRDKKFAYPGYYIVNRDEPYAQEVIDLILTREGEKKK